MTALFCRYQDGRRVPGVLPLGVALGRARLDRCPMIGPRLYASPAEAEEYGCDYAYLPVLDFDGDGAVRDCAAFIAQVLRPAGLVPGVDVHVAASSPGRRKLFWRRPWPAWGGGWAEALHSWVSEQRAAYPSLDPQQSLTSTARWIGSQHLTGRRVWCHVLGAEGDAACRRAPTPAERAAWTTEEEPAWDAVARRVQLHHLLHRVEEWAGSRKGARALRNRAGVKVRFDLSRILAVTGLRSRPIRSGVRLSTCPECGHQHVAAVFAGSCVLHCLRVSCPANTALAPQQWVPPKMHAACQIEAEDDGAEQRTARVIRFPLEEARRRTAERVAEALDEDGPPVVLRVTPGVGKSHAMIAAVVERARRAGRSYLITVPTRELAEETRRAIEDTPNSPRVMTLEPRSGENCTRIGTAMAAAQRGYSPGRAVCPRCPDRDWCAYQASLRMAARTPILVGVWEHEELLRGGRLGARDLIVDEAPLRVRLSDEAFDAVELSRWASAGERVEDAAEAGLVAGWLLRACELATRSGVVGGARVAEAVRLLAAADLGSPSAADRVLADAALSVERLRAYEAGALADEAPALIMDRPNLRALEAVVELDRLRRSPDTATGLRIERGTLCLARLRRPAQAPRLVLDAYATQGLYDRILGAEVDLVRVDAEMPARIWRVHASTSKAALARKGDAAMDPLRASVRSLVLGGHAQVLVVAAARTLPAAVAAAEEAAAETGLPCVIHGRHAYAGAGSNAYASCSAVVAVITPSLRPEIEGALTGALYHGEARVVPGDPRLDVVRSVWGADELLQQVHRARPAVPHPERTRDVVIVAAEEVSLPDLSGEAARAEEVGDAARVEWVRSRLQCWSPHLAHWVIPGWLGSGAAGQRRMDRAVRLALGRERPGEIRVAGQRVQAWGDARAAQVLYGAVEARVMAGEGEAEAFAVVGAAYGFGRCA